MNTKLITGLRTAANALEQGTFYYDWSFAHSCNCGALFCALTGRSSSELNQIMPKALGDSDHTWRARVGQHCPITGMPSDALFKELFSYGLTQKDIIHFEFLSDPTIVARMQVPPPTSARRRWYQLRIPKPRRWPDYHNHLHAAAYMRAWADLLTEQGAGDMAPRMQPEQVS